MNQRLRLRRVEAFTENFSFALAPVFKGKFGGRLDCVDRRQRRRLASARLARLLARQSEDRGVAGAVAQFFVALAGFRSGHGGFLAREGERAFE